MCDFFIPCSFHLTQETLIMVCYIMWFDPNRTITAGSEESWRVWSSLWICSVWSTCRLRTLEEQLLYCIALYVSLLACSVWSMCRCKVFERKKKNQNNCYSVSYYTALNCTVIVLYWIICLCCKWIVFYGIICLSLRCQTYTEDVQSLEEHLTHCVVLCCTV